MSIGEMARILRSTVRDAPEGEIVVSIHLFGIRHAKALDGISIKELVNMAGIHASYHTEIRKGINLAKFVALR